MNIKFNKIKINLIFTLLLFCLLFSFINVKALDYSKTYEQAFPDKEFRKLILTCIKYNVCNYNSEPYLKVNPGLFALVKQAAYYDEDPIRTANVDENLINSMESSLLNKADLDKITYLLSSKNGYPSKMYSLKGIEYLTNLEYIAFENISTKEIDLRENKKLIGVAFPTNVTSPSSSHYAPYDYTSKIDYPLPLKKAILERVNVEGIASLQGIMYTLNSDINNKINLNSNPQIKEIIIVDSNLTNIEFNSASQLDRVILYRNSLSEVTIAEKIQANDLKNNFYMWNQKFKVAININEDMKIPFKFSFDLANKIGWNGNYIFKAFIPSPDVTKNNDTYEFKNIKLGSNLFEIKMPEVYQIKYSGILEIEVSKNNTNNISKNPKTGIKTFVLITSFIFLISYVIFKYINKHKKYIK